jgi:hypothetical protein
MAPRTVIGRDSINRTATEVPGRTGDVHPATPMSEPRAVDPNPPRPAATATVDPMASSSY